VDLAVYWNQQMGYERSLLAVEKNKQLKIYFNSSWQSEQGKKSVKIKKKNNYFMIQNGKVMQKKKAGLKNTEKTKAARKKSEQ
jgi:hypothetical protein